MRTEPVTGRGRPGGFTLMELIVAISLLTLLMLGCSFVFDNASKAMGEASAINETTLNAARFDTIWRRDVAAMEHDGILVIGSRKFDDSVPAYSMRRRKDAGQFGRFRCDWITFITNSEQSPNIDPRMMGLAGRVLFGHGYRTDKASADFRDTATDWMLMRHLYVQRVSRNPADVQLSVERQTDIDNSQYMIDSHAARVFQWYGGGSPINEPNNYFRYLPVDYSRRESWGKGVLPYCAEFRIEYAMRGDMANGSIAWRQPPMVGNGNAEDPNYLASDPLHGNRFNTDGRLSFGPGDEWPALLRVTIIVVDPLDRIGEQRTSITTPVP